MRFAIDYDGTFAADPALFHQLIELLRAHGHDCVVVTGRSADPPWGAEVIAALAGAAPIVFAAGGWKRQAARQRGYEIDVWIDDAPEYVGPQDAPEVLAFREERRGS